MHTSNVKENFSSDNPIWVLLVELSFSDFLSDHDRKDGLMAGSMFQMIQEFGMPAEFMENIAGTLAGFAQEALAHQKQENAGFPWTDPDILPEKDDRGCKCRDRFGA